MHYSKLSVAGCAALMFGLIACSGEDGADGANGTNGLNGTSCEVKSLKTGDGYKVLCGGDSVGVLLNGKTGATGKQGATGAQGKKGETGKTGESCSVKPITGGYDVYCGSEKVGQLKNGVAGQSCTTAEATDGIEIICGSEKTTLKFKTCSVEETADTDGTKGLTMNCDDGTTGTVWNGKSGTNCTADVVIDKKTGKEGIQMSCGGTVVGTVWNGENGESGVSCESKDNGDGTVTVSCGDAKPVTVYKAMCADNVYDPANQFCVLGKLYDKCGGKTFVVNREYCNDGVVADLCAEVKKSKTNDYSVVTYRPVNADEFCLAGIVTKKCGGKTFGMNQYCGKNYAGTADSIRAYCRDADAQDLDEAYAFIGQTIYQKDDVVEETTKPNFFGDLIGEPLVSADSRDLNKFYAALEELKTSGCTSEGRTELCGTKEYFVDKQFCDVRDNHLYNYKKIPISSSSIYWMTENLAYEYKLPKTKVKKITQTDNGPDTTYALDILGGKLNFEKQAYENFPATNGRFYTWKSAMGIGDLRKKMSETQPSTYAALNLDSSDVVFGACPAGWRLPTSEELEALSRYATSTAEGGFADLNNDKDVVLNFNVNFLGYYDVDAKGTDGVGKAYFWSSTAIEGEEEDAYSLIIKDNDHASVDASHKTYAFTIRCVADEQSSGGDPFIVDAFDTFCANPDNDNPGCGFCEVYPRDASCQLCHENFDDPECQYFLGLSSGGSGSGDDDGGVCGIDDDDC